ncbi:Ig-like domain-containing protein [uncultured Draconibacterium sp.]|uniref:VPS10 domain-containing protein n=1 Tax=uncultured Draconibacterium sp. TaxID=1573823 RepID=UPI0032600F0F
MKNLITFLFLALTLSVNAQSNLIPDGSFEEGVIDGDNSAYYKLNWETVWRIWPHMRFDYESENVNSGERALKLSYEVYTGSAENYQPTFRCEAFPPLEDASYRFSFYYKTDTDRSGETFDLRFSEGTQLSGNQNFANFSVPIEAAAKDGFVELAIEFQTGKEMAGFLPFIEVPWLDESAWFYIDDVSLVKVVDTPEAWGPTPENNAIGITTTTTLNWQSGKGAIAHNLYFGTSENELELLGDSLSSNFYDLNNLENESQYFWRVDEIDSVGVVATGEVWNFTTRTYYEEYMYKVKNERMESDSLITWKQFGPGNSGFVNFLRYHPTLPDVCITSPDMGNTYQTNDNGKSWYTIKDIDGDGSFYRLYDAFYSTKTAAFGIAIESSRLWTTSDTGRHWQNIKHCPWYDNDAEGNDTRSWYRKVSAVAIDPANDDTWYVGAGNFCRGQQQLWGSTKDANAENPRGVDSNNMGRIWKTSDAGETWTELTSGIDTKAQFSRIIVHPENSNMVFAGSNYGLYKSVDGGQNWTNIGEGKLDNNTIINMDYYYNAGTGKFVLYVADQVRYYPNGSSTRCDGGIFKSENNGNTWQNINGNIYLDINRLTGGVPYNYYLYIARWFGITVAEAQQQYPVKPVKALQYFNSINVDPSQENTLYLGFYDAQVQQSIIPGRLWKTTDGGQSWINMARDYATVWEADQSYWQERNNPVSDNVVTGHKPTNQQWGVNYPLRSLRYAAVNSRGDVMILYAHNTLLSTDGGATFKQVDETYTGNGNIMGTGNSNLPGQCLWQDKRLGEGVLYCGSGEHNLWRTTNDGSNGNQAAKFIEGTQESVFAVTTHPWDENTVYTTSMRQKDLDRIFKSTDGGENWVDWGKATEAEEWMRTNHLRIDPVNPDNMYFAVTEVAGSGGGSGTDGPDKDKEGGFHKSSNAGLSFAPSNAGMPAKVWVRDIEFDPRDDTRASLFVAAPWSQETGTHGGLFHSTNRGQSWTEIPVADNLEGINNVCFDHTGRLYVTAGRRAANGDNGGVFYSDDYGITWTQIFEAPFMDNFDVSPFDHNLLVLSQGTLAKNPGIFVSRDRGLTWSKNNRTMGQPNVITQVEFDLHDETTLWLSVMGSGFYRGDFPQGTISRKIRVSPGTAKIKVAATLQLELTLNETAGNVIYKSANESIATVTQDGLVTGQKEGAVKIWVTSDDGRYSDFVYLVVNNITSTTQFEKNEIKVFPNPAIDKLYFSGNTDDFHFQLFSSTGMLLKDIRTNQSQSVDVSDLSGGLYVFKIVQNNRISSGKIIKK